MLFTRRSSQHGCCSTTGRRAVNEDRAATLALGGNRYVAVVADGMGGVRGGDVASEAALRAFVDSVRTQDAGDAEATLQTAFAAADEAIRGAATPEREGMGSTLVAAIAHNSVVCVGNIGDSRAVLVTADEVIPLSTQHSVVGEAFRRGEISEVDALRHPERHVISRAIGDGDAQPEMKLSLADGDRGRSLVLLGSDGLFNFIGDCELLELTVEPGTAGEVANRVVRRAVENGSDDNVSAAAILIPAARPRSPLRVALAVVLLAALAGGVYRFRDAIVRHFASPLKPVAHSKAVAGGR